jgi:DNA-binding XRE family transcriptional regulator
MSFSPEAWKRLGVLFEAARHRLGLGRAAFAVRAGISEKAVYNAESGDEHAKVPPTFHRYAAAIGWAPESIRAVLAGGDPIASERESSGSASSAADPDTAPPDEPTLLELLTHVNEFGRLCVALGADSALRDDLDATAQRLVQSIPRDIIGREFFGLAAYRPHAPGEGPATDDAERAVRAMEEHR